MWVLRGQGISKKCAHLSPLPPAFSSGQGKARASPSEVARRGEAPSLRSPPSKPRKPILWGTHSVTFLAPRGPTPSPTPHASCLRLHAKTIRRLESIARCKQYRLWGGGVPESCVCMYAREKKPPLKKAYVTYLLEPWLEDCLGGFLCPLQVQQAGPGVLLSGRNMAWPGVCRNNKAQLAHKSTARWLTS